MPKVVRAKPRRERSRSDDRTYLREQTQRSDNGGNTLVLRKAEADVHIGSDDYVPARTG